MIKTLTIDHALSAIVAVSVGLAIFNVDSPVRVALALFSTCFVPGFLLIRGLRIRLEFHELAPISVVFSMVILTLLGFYLSMTPLHITPSSVLISILCFTAILQLSFHFFRQYRQMTIRGSCRFFLRELDKRKGLLFLMIIAGLMPVFLSIDDILRYQYYLGYDPYRNEPLISSIIQDDLDPFAFLGQQKMVFSGFYYLGAVLHVSTGISIHNFTRFGGIGIFSLLSIVLLIVSYRVFNDRWMTIIPFFFAMNPFVINRFVMAIRENVAFLFLTLMIFFLVKMNKDNKKCMTVVSAMIFGVILSTNPITLVFSSSLVFFFILADPGLRIYGLMILSGCLFVFPMLGAFTVWLSWAVVAQFQIFLDYATLQTSSWLSEQEILSKWGRDIFLQDFSILEIALLPLGILHIKRRRSKCPFRKLFFVVSFFFSALMLYLLARFGFHFTPARLVIYIALPLATLSALGLKEAIVRVSKYMPTHTTETSTIGKTATRKTVREKLTIAIVISTIFLSSIPIIGMNKWCPYVSSQVEAAVWLRQSVQNKTDAIVIPSTNDMGLIDYVGIEDAIYWENMTLVKDIMHASSFDELRGLVRTNYPDRNEAYFFMSQRWREVYERENDFTILEILENISLNGECVERVFDQTALIFRIGLHKDIVIIKDDDGEIDEWVGISFNHRKAMKELSVLDNLDTSSVTLLIYLNKRDFDKSGTFEGSWFLSINGCNHTYSWEDIPANGGWVKKRVPAHEILTGHNEIIVFKQSPDHIFIGLDADNDFNQSAFYYSHEWNYEELGRWYGVFDGEYMIRFAVTISD